MQKKKETKISPSIPVENFRNVLSYMCADLSRSIRLTTYLRYPLIELFGPHNATFKGEFKYYVWIIEFEGEIFNIFTASKKGTQFEIVSNGTEDKSEVCLRFLKEFDSKMTPQIFGTIRA